MNGQTATAYEAPARKARGALLFAAAAMVVIGAWNIPFFYESTSMWYKFGLHKTLLRAGKMVGLTAALLVSLQVVLASRFHFLDRIFSLNRLYTLHRLNGLMIATLLLVHPNLILAADNFTLPRPEWKYWPEFLGMGLAAFFFSLIAAAFFRPALRIAYSTWQPLHRLSTLLVVTVLPFHILLVSDTFKAVPPRLFILALVCLNLFLFLRIWLRRLWRAGRTYRLVKVEKAGKDAVSIEAAVPPGRVFRYLPGQFAFVTAISPLVKKEEHPFSITSSPARPGSLQFVIRDCGDWTATAGRLRPGDIISVDGPYGLFSQLAIPPAASLLMIAGGIGITPLLGMLRYMADTGDHRPTLLIWSNRTTGEIIFPEEFHELARALPGLRIIHHLTRDPAAARGRLDHKQLDAYLRGWDRKAGVFLCGPPEMMKDMKTILTALGFKNIYHEEFSL